MKPNTALRTCVSPEGRFVYGIHRPAYRVENFRENDSIGGLGYFTDGSVCENSGNFPPGAVDVEAGGTVYEIPNAFDFRGTTYINKEWADRNAADPSRIRLPEPPEVGFAAVLRKIFGEGSLPAGQIDRLIRLLPEPVCLALAETGTDPEDLVRLADIACEFIRDPNTGRPAGLRYERDPAGRPRPVIHRHMLFEVLANNAHLPDDYKEVMVLRPGVQGGSEIVGEWEDPDNRSHVFEYLRSNSYIPWGHYAANMANDAVRYRLQDLTPADMSGMRHLYYQRTYARVAGELGLSVGAARRRLSESELELLRQDICRLLESDNKPSALTFNRTLWGWNFGFDYAPSGYRQHASHQQVHQQYAMIPRTVPARGVESGEMAAYACGDRIDAFAAAFRAATGVPFFDAYLRAIEGNERLDGAPPGDSSLVVYADEHVIVFVPKAQTSQWELQLMTRVPVGNVIEADWQTRRSIDRAMLAAVKALSALGARLITTIEMSKRIDSEDADQRLLYGFLPRMPESPGAFSEAQLRWINGHYPEDFAAACRTALEEMDGFGKS